MLSTVKLRKRYGKREVVKDVSIVIAPGEIVGLLGPNGAGKSTTFHMIVGLARPLTGSVLLNGREISHEPMHVRARLGLGYLPQEPTIFRKLSVQDNLNIILELLPISEAEKTARAEKLLRELGLENRRNQLASTLSGGEKRRLEICRALLVEPKFLLLDEPFVGIDPITISDLQNILGRLKSQGLGILMTDHNVRDTLRITDRAYLIHDGQVLLEGDAATLTQNPEARRIYLGHDFEF